MSILLFIWTIPILGQIGFKNEQMYIEHMGSFDAHYACMTDLDNNGLVDLICLAERKSNNFNLQEGLYFLTFKQDQTGFNVPDTFWLPNRFYGAQAMYGGDFLGDSLTEIAVAYGWYLEVFRYMPNGDFEIVDSICLNAPIIDMKVNDLYNDDTSRFTVVTGEFLAPGSLHVITPRDSGELHRWSTGSVGFVTTQSDIGFGDFNNDGFTDITIYGAKIGAMMSGVAIWRGSATGMQTQYDFFYHENIAPMGRSSATGDFNSDGLDDIAVLCRNNLIDTTFVVWFQDTGYTFNKKVFLGEGRTYQNDLVSGHFSCSGKDDLVTLSHHGNSNGYVCFEQIDTGFLMTVSYPQVFLNSDDAGRQVVDVDNDGLDDILRVGRNRIGIDYNISDTLTRIDTISAIQSYDSTHIQLDTVSFTFLQTVFRDTVDSIIVRELNYLRLDSIYSDTSTFVFTDKIIQTKSCLVYSYDTIEYVDEAFNRGTNWTFSNWTTYDTTLIPAVPADPIDTQPKLLIYRLRLYPNPTTAEIFFEWNTPTPPEYEVIVSSTRGQIVLTETTPSSIDLSSIASGVYIVHVPRFGVREKIIRL